MDKRGDRAKTITLLSLPLLILMIITSSTGLFTHDFYSRETANWEAQAIGQDAIDLFLVAPVLVITYVLVLLKKQNAFSLWGGVNLYLVYTYVIYCFDVHVNSLFVLYCLALGLSFYSFVYFLFSQKRESFQIELFKKTAIRTIAIYFLIVPAIFYFLWLSEIIPASISHQPPQSLTDTGLFTNPVHVLDLSVVLPGIFVIGVSILKRYSFGMSLIPAILVFFILMDITIGILAIFMRQRGIGEGLGVTIIMALLAVFSGLMLTWYLKALKSFRSD